MPSCNPQLWKVNEHQSPLSTSLAVAMHWSEPETRSWYRVKCFRNFTKQKWGALKSVIVLAGCAFSLKLKNVHKPKNAQFWTANWIQSLTSQISILNLSALWCEWMGALCSHFYADSCSGQECFSVSNAIYLLEQIQLCWTSIFQQQTKFCH